jgi:hypothetical protein
MSSNAGSQNRATGAETGHRLQLLREAAARRLARQAERSTFERLEAVGRELAELADDLSDAPDVAYTAYVRNSRLDPRG